MASTVFTNFGKMDLDALDKEGCLGWTVSLTEDLDAQILLQLESIKRAFNYRFGSVKTAVGTLTPFDSVRVSHGGWSRVRTVRLYDKSGGNAHEVNFYVTSSVVPYRDPEGEKPIEGHPGLEIQLRIRRIRE